MGFQEGSDRHANEVMNFHTTLAHKKAGCFENVAMAHDCRKVLESSRPTFTQFQLQLRHALATIPALDMSGYPTVLLQHRVAGNRIRIALARTNINFRFAFQTVESASWGTLAQTKVAKESVAKICQDALRVRLSRLVCSNKFCGP